MTHKSLACEHRNPPADGCARRKGQPCSSPTALSSPAQRPAQPLRPAPGRPLLLPLPPRMYHQACSATAIAKHYKNRKTNKKAPQSLRPIPISSYNPLQVTMTKSWPTAEAPQGSHNTDSPTGVFCSFFNAYNFIQL